MPNLKKRNFLKNLKVAWAPQANGKKRKLAEVSGERKCKNQLIGAQLPLNKLIKIPMRHSRNTKKIRSKSPELEAFPHAPLYSADLTCLADPTRQFRHLLDFSYADPVSMSPVQQEMIPLREVLNSSATMTTVQPEMGAMPSANIASSLLPQKRLILKKTYWPPSEWCHWCQCGNMRVVPNSLCMLIRKD
jgi:hypothetical protein